MKHPSYVFDIKCERCDNLFVIDLRHGGYLIEWDIEINAFTVASADALKRNNSFSAENHSLFDYKVDDSSGLWLR